MNKFFRHYFAFSSTERNGILVLLIILLLLIVAPFLIKKVYKTKIYDYSSYEAELDSLLFEEPDSRPTKHLKSVKLFLFDPNTVNKNELKILGFNTYQIRNLTKYRKKGGKFYSSADLKKIYGIDELFYNTIKKYIHIAGQEAKTTFKNMEEFDPNKINDSIMFKMNFPKDFVENLNKYRENAKFFKTKKDFKYRSGITNEQYNEISDYIIIDTAYISYLKSIEIKNRLIIRINSTDSLTLQLLIKNNPELVRRILKYRDMLGGFYNKAQLNEVYGISYYYKSIIENLEIDSSNIKKININKVEFKTLNKHPYISYDETKAIFAYRKIMGEFTNVEQIVKNKLFEPEKFNKIQPYLVISD